MRLNRVDNKKYFLTDDFDEHQFPTAMHSIQLTRRYLLPCPDARTRTITVGGLIAHGITIGAVDGDHNAIG